ncbi:MAG: hypothetical protein HC836_16705 [Richelia sp. RM2_1_2]|nr:hypothetical protein [Richelia sp. RM2_1_2]
MNKIEATFYKDNKIVYTTIVPYSITIYGLNSIEVSRVIAVTELMFKGIIADKLIIGETEFDMKPDLSVEWFVFE